MKRIVLPNTNTTVSRISYGTGSIHHIFWSAERQRLLDGAYDFGLTHFDTSPYYGFGMSELEIGKFAKGKRDKVTFTTKIGLYSPGRFANNFAMLARKAGGKILPKVNLPIADWTLKRAEKSLNDSLSRLQTDYVDFLFLHEPDASLIMNDEFVSWLKQQKNSGKIRNCGLAGITPSIKQYVEEGSRLAQVVQTRDTIGSCDADFLINNERELQFTYGYMSATGHKERTSDIYREALVRNATGSILMCTRRIKRIEETVKSLEQN